MREGSDHYRRATEAAWQAVCDKLEIIKKKLGIEKVELEGISYDSDAHLTRIDELPDEPKSSHPKHAEVRVSLEAFYRIVREP